MTDDTGDDQSWVLDSLVGFLKGPLWSSSLNNFIDQKSIVFEADNIEDEDGDVLCNQEYESIFKEYCGLVDQLISSHMAELNINEKQFAIACEMADGLLANKLKKILFEELLAAENYEVFVRMMAKRNVELQLEALEVLAQQHGLVYDMFVPIGISKKNFLSEEHVLREAILRSMNDDDNDETEHFNISQFNSRRYSGENSKVKKSKTFPVNVEVNKVETEVSIDHGIDKDSVERDHARLEEVKYDVDKKMQRALKSAVSRKVAFEEPKEETKPEPVLEPTPPPATPVEAEPMEKSETKSEETEPSDSQPNHDDDVRKRADYLRQQRDKIIQLKHKERNDRISKYMTKRNQSAGSTKDPVESESTNSGGANPTGSDLAFRKTLAARLKAEVIDGRM